MLISALKRKLLRDLWRLKGQIATIALVLASGIASFIMLRGTSDRLASSRDAYYDRNRFADVFATLERAPEALARQIEALPGVAALETRITDDILVPIEGMKQPAAASLLSLPQGRPPATNALHLVDGRTPARADANEVVVLASFAEAHGLRPGHTLPGVINGRLRQLRIVGIAQSPEYVFAVRPGAMVEDSRRYAVLWMDRSALGVALQLEGAFNEVSLRLQPGASTAEVLARLDRLLEPYGGNGAYARVDQLSNKVLNGELNTLAGLANMVPLVFLGVAVFLVRLVLGRLITLQRTEIAVLKAIGYKSREVGYHYLGLVAIVLAPSWLLGLFGGQWLGEMVLNLYAAVFRFPDLEFHLTAPLVAWALLAGAVGAGGGALLAVRAAVQLPPAEAMRPPAPARYRRNLFERFGFAALAGPHGMMVFRESFRRPLRTLLSALGIGGAVSLLILGRFGWDSMMDYFEGTFFREQRHDLSVAFRTPVSPRVVGELGRMPGVITAEPVRAVPVRVQHQHRARDTVLMGLSGEATLRRLVEQGGREVPLPEDGVLVTLKLGELLDLRAGDRLELKIKEGERPVVRPVVAGFVDEAAGLFVYARTASVAALEHDLGAVSAVVLRVDPLQASAIHERLLDSPHVIDVTDIKADMQQQLDQHAAMFDVWTFIAVLLASSVIFGVVYNNARISLTARSRDLASLRVLGFSRREISLVLIGSLAVEVALAIPLGLLLGYAWAQQFASSFDQETFRMVAVVAPRTYLLATAITLLSAAASALWVRRDLDRLDLLGVLKTRE